MEFKTCFNLGDIVEIVVRYATAYEHDILYNVSINNGEKTVLAADPEYCNLDRCCNQKEAEINSQIYKVIRHYIPYDADYIGTEFRADAGVINRNAPVCGGIEKPGLGISNPRVSS